MWGVSSRSLEGSGGEGGLLSTIQGFEGYVDGNESVCYDGTGLAQCS
eukprot:CAMPEP_0174337540 /NCGR_PEP_ID=MMETSP0810-20121108/22402_1 /TAXON_ID=73025 ORGANISM="Eutreptiella gymnastica-like, Strain CCMP1594" /NCGR_SAMPLE_ID=MMETSP0810 /ASSEMBLY_ACC=CAM_ASM_000659 /LENGTH=46 /DNA_ID= /DNA_START= /DNA_END= /DNA_ORIENTATION=